jgi:carbonic anhydrase
MPHSLPFLKTACLAALVCSLAACETINGTGSHSAAATSDHAPAATAHHGAHWGYDGATGPQHWGDMKAEYGACAAGAQQSPIDLHGARIADLAAPQVNWHAFTGEVVNNGHTIQVNAEPGSSMVLEGKTYELLQFHFHHASEHTVDGYHYPLEAHFVHKAADGTLGVLGVFFEEGASNPLLEHIWTLAPTGEGEADETLHVDPFALLPNDRRMYRYEGSLTTPPCSEVVEWVVFKRPMQASKIQLAAFAAVFDHNYRPTQPLNRRYILGSK